MLAAWAFAVAVTFVPGIYGAPLMPRWWVIALGLPLVPRFDLRAINPYVLGCMAVVTLWSALGLIWTPALYGGALSIGCLALMFAVAVAIAGSDVQDCRDMLIAFGVGIGVSGVIAVAQEFGLTAIPQSHTPGGLFYSPEVLAEIAAPILVWCFWEKIYWLAGVLAVPIVLCQERGAWLVTGVGLLYGWSPSRRWHKSLALAALSLVGCAALFVRMASADQRILLWGTAVRSITFRGGGVGWWFQAHPFPFEEFVHSDVLQTLVELGAGGLALIAIPFIVFRRGLPDVALRSAFLCLCIEAVISFPLHLPAACFLLAVCAGGLSARRVDVRVPGLQGGTDDRRSHRWAGASAWRSLDVGGWGDRILPVRSAFTQRKGVGSRRGCEANAEVG